MKIDWKTFSLDVRYAMRTGYIGVRELGRESGLDKATISRARTGKTLNATSYMWVCHVFDLDPWKYAIHKSRLAA